MPNKIKLNIVEESTIRLKEASGIYFARYTGMDVVQATEFRKMCRETSVNYTITKNTLIRADKSNVESFWETIFSPFPTTLCVWCTFSNWSEKAAPTSVW